MKLLMKDGLMDAHTDGKGNYWVFPSFFLREEKTEDGIKYKIIYNNGNGAKMKNQEFDFNEEMCLKSLYKKLHQAICMEEDPEFAESIAKCIAYIKYGVPIKPHNENAKSKKNDYYFYRLEEIQGHGIVLPKISSKQKMILQGHENDPIIKISIKEEE